MLRHDAVAVAVAAAVWGARRVMWRQADNPLAPGDKYEVRRTFSAARDHPRLNRETSKRKERERERESTHKMRPSVAPSRNQFPAGKSLSHQIMAAADRLPRRLRTPIRRRIFFFLPFLARFTLPRCRGYNARRNPREPVKLQRARPSRKLPSETPGCARARARHRGYLSGRFFPRDVCRVVRLRCKYS